MQYLALTIGGQKIEPPADYTGPRPEHLYNPPRDSGLKIINGALTIFLTVGVIAALITIIWAGIQWASSEGDKQKVAAAKGRLTWGIIGLIICLISFFIINVIGSLFGVSLLNFSLS